MASQGPYRKAYQRRGGFKQAGQLMEKRIRNAGEARGFAVTRLLTHWADIVGEDTANTASPVNVSYGKGGFGATLTVLPPASMAPMLQMQLPRIREKVNACYGYNAISRIRITQTAPTGFAEGQAQFAPKVEAAPEPDPKAAKEAQDLAADIENDSLRQALSALGENIMTSAKRTT